MFSHKVNKPPKRLFVVLLTWCHIRHACKPQQPMATIGQTLDLGHSAGLLMNHRLVVITQPRILLLYYLGVGEILIL